MKKLMLLLLMLLLISCGKSESISDKVESLKYGQFEVDQIRDDSIFELLLIEDDVMYYTYISKNNLRDIDEEQNYNAKIYSQDKEGNEQVVADDIGYKLVSSLVLLDDTLYFLTNYTTVDLSNDESSLIVDVYKKEADSESELLKEYSTLGIAQLPKLYIFNDSVYGLIQEIEFKADNNDSYQKNDSIYNFSNKEVAYEIDSNTVKFNRIKEDPYSDDSSDMTNQIHFGSTVDVGEEYLTFSTMRYKGNGKYNSEIYLYDGEESLFDDENKNRLHLEDEINENPIVLGDNIIYLSRETQSEPNHLKIISNDDPSVYKNYPTQYQTFINVFNDDDTAIIFTSDILGRQCFKALTIEDEKEVIFTDVNLFTDYKETPFLIDGRNKAKIIYLENKTIIEYIK